MLSSTSCHRAFAPALCVSAFLGLASTLNAAGIAVDESSFGEFNSNLGFPTLVTPDLGLGLNTITGSLPPEFSLADTDVFTVVLPDTLDITSISMDVTNYVGVVDGDGFFQLLFAADGNTGFQSVNGNGAYPLSYVLGDPTNISFRVIGPENPFEFEVGSFDYTLNITTAVPEPTSLGLLAGTAAMALRRRRR